MVRNVKNPFCKKRGEQEEKSWREFSYEARGNDKPTVIRKIKISSGKETSLNRGVEKKEEERKNVDRYIISIIVFHDISKK